jgi:ABC-type oligopeptide transport system ATPase subunit
MERRSEGTRRKAHPSARLQFLLRSSQVLFDLNMDIPERQVTALIGPSGCGKSTLLRNINRMNDLIDGISHRGRHPDRRPKHLRSVLEVISLRKRIGMVFQKSNPFPKSIYENIVYSLRVAGRNRRRNWTRPSSGRCGPPRCGTKSRTGCRKARSACPAARCSGCASPAPSPTGRRSCDGRTVLGARSRRHRQDRGTDPRTEEGIHDRHRDPQHAAGRAGLGPHRLPVHGQS